MKVLIEKFISQSEYLLIVWTVSSLRSSKNFLSTRSWYLTLSRSDQSNFSSARSMKVQLNFRKLSRKPHSLYARVKCMKRENSSKISIKWTIEKRVFWVITCVAPPAHAPVTKIWKDVLKCRIRPIPLKPWFFFRLLLSNCLSWKIYCDDHSSLARLNYVPRGVERQPSQRLMIKCLTIIQIELEFRNVGFWGKGKTGVPWEKPLGAE